MKTQSAIILYIIASILVACTPLGPTPAPSALPTIPHTQTSTTPVISSPTLPATDQPTATLIPTTEPAPHAVATSSVPLAMYGPWLVYINSNQQLSAVNQDGTGSKQIESYMPAPYFRVVGYSNSGLLTVFTYDDQNSINLELIQLPDATNITVIPLLSYYDNEVHGEMDGGPDGPVGGVGSRAAWSPNGQQLAFMGAIDGPTSDLYIYDSVEDTVIRLTTGEDQAATPIWSPDGKWVIHESVESFHGWSTSGIWAASVEGAEVKLLYEPEHHISQTFYGWVGQNRFIVADHGMDGERNIRIVNVETGGIETLFGGYFLAAAFDLETGAVALTPFPGAPGVGPEFEKIGIYLISKPGATPTLIVPDTIDVNMSADGFFFTHKECVPEKYFAFTVSGELQCLQEKPIDTSPDGLWSVSFDGGLSLYDNELNGIAATSEITNGTVHWAPNSQGFFVETKELLYYTEVPKLKLQIVDQISEFGDFMWVKSTSE